MIDRRSGGPVEILLVEDNPGDVRLTREAWKEGKLRNNLHVAEDAVEALAFLREQGRHVSAARTPTLTAVPLAEPTRPPSRVTQYTLPEPGRVHFDLERTDRLSAALGRIARETFDLILLDLTLPDSWGLDTFVRIHDASPNTPV